MPARRTFIKAHLGREEGISVVACVLAGAACATNQGKGAAIGAGGGGCGIGALVGSGKGPVIAGLVGGRGRKKNLDDFAKVLTKYPDTNLIVEGHTDNTGKKRKNQKLSEAHAQAVIWHLRSAGVERRCQMTA